MPSSGDEPDNKEEDAASCIKTIRRFVIVAFKTYNDVCASHANAHTKPQQQQALGKVSHFCYQALPPAPSNHVSAMI